MAKLKCLYRNLDSVGRQDLNINGGGKYTRNMDRPEQFGEKDSKTQTRSETGLMTDLG